MTGGPVIFEFIMGNDVMCSLQLIPVAVTMQISRRLIKAILSTGENYLSFKNSRVLLDPGRKNLPKRHQGSFGGQMFGQASV